MANCYSCGLGVSGRPARCPNCGGQQFGDSVYFDNNSPALPDLKDVGLDLTYPLNGLYMPPRAIVVVSGEGGAGKTTLGMQLRPKIYDSAEQNVEALKRRAETVFHGGTLQTPLTFRHIKKGEYPELPLGKRARWIVDSLSTLVDGETWYEETLVPWAQSEDKERFVVVILHATKAGEYAGSSRIRHWCDVHIHLSRDAALMLNVATCTKNRYGPTWRRYFACRSRIHRPQFYGPHALEPMADGFQLVPPWEKSKWHPWAIQDGNSAMPEEIECAAVAGIPLGRKPDWSLPDDVGYIAGRRFCFDHGVCFVDGDHKIHHHPGCPHGN